MSNIMTCHRVANRLLYVLFFGVFCISAYVNASQDSDEEAYAINKSPNDNKEYRYFRLDNGLQVVVVSDPETRLSAAALDVGCGSAHEPDSHLGLAHLLEHMLFINNEKYPEIDGFNQFLAFHGGTRQAMTDNYNTYYNFDVKCEQLEPALDRFLQFFISPSFDPQYIKREVQVVHAEFSTNFNNDDVRGRLVVTSLCNPENPCNRFSVGNNKTLNAKDGESLEAELKALYHKYYHFSNMALSVLGRESVDVLERQVRAIFAEISDTKSPEDRKTIPIITQKELGRRITIKCSFYHRVLQIILPFPGVWSAYNKKPLECILYLLSHKAPGSLFSVLLDCGWIKSMDSSCQHVCAEDWSHILLSFVLTKMGLEYLDDITLTFVDYVKSIRRCGVQESIYDEFSQMHDLSFQFNWRKSAKETVLELAKNMHYYPIKDLLGVQKIYFDDALIHSCLDKIEPRNILQVLRIRQQINGGNIEPYYGTEYSVSPLIETIDNSVLISSNYDNFLLDTTCVSNPFIPRNVSLQSLEGQDTFEPKVIDKDPGFILWSLTDTRNREPKGSIYIRISSCMASDSLLNYQNRSLYEILLFMSPEINKLHHLARYAGLKFTFSTDQHGLQCILYGYHDKQDLFLRSVIPFFRDIQFNEEEVVKARGHLIGHRLGLWLDPYKHMGHQLENVLCGENTEIAMFFSALIDLSKERIHTYLKDFYKSAHITMMVHGNFSNDEAMKLGNIVRQKLLAKTPVLDIYKPKTLLCNETAIEYKIRLSYNDSAILMYYQATEKGLAMRARYYLLRSIIESDFYLVMRTEMQVGYKLNTLNDLRMGYAAICFMIQSPKVKPQELEKKISEYLISFRTKLMAFSDKKLQGFKEGCMSKLTQKDSNFSNTSEHLWQSISNDDFFYIDQYLAQAVQLVTLEDLNNLIDEMVQKKNQLVIQGYSSES